jgi:hypothetical protein
MNSLTELKDHLSKLDIEVKDFTGWQLTVGKDVWTMIDGIFYRNGLPQGLKERGLFDNYKRKKQYVEHQSDQTRKWRGISSRNYK